MRIIRVIGRHPQLTTSPENTGDNLKRTRLDEAALMVPELWPRIREKHKDPRQAGIWQSPQNAQRVIHMNTDIGHTAGTHLRKQLCDTIFEGLASNKTGRGVQPRLLHKMLTPTKPHLEGKVSSPWE